MVDIKKIKIRKRTFSFELKNRFRYERLFKVKKVSPLKHFLNSLSSLFRTKSKKSLYEIKGEKKGPEKKGVSVGKILLIFSLFILIFGSAFLFIYFNFLGKPTSEGVFVAPPKINPSLLFEFSSKGIIPSNENNVGYFVFSLFSKNISKINLSVNVYPAKIPTEVFVLISEREQATTYPAFKRYLEKHLWEYGIQLNEISFKELETLPSPSIIVVPSGVLPEKFFTSPDVSLPKLTLTGHVIIYIGLPFNKMLTENKITVTTPQEYLKPLPFSFTKPTITTSNNLHIFQPLYDVQGGSLYSGVVSVVGLNNGFIVFVPQTLDGGWRDTPEKTAPELAALDITKIIIDHPWAIPLGTTEKVMDVKKSFMKKSIFTPPINQHKAFLEVIVLGQDVNGGLHTERKYTFISKTSRGRVTFFPYNFVLPTNISSSELRVNILLNEPKPTKETIILKCYKDDEEVYRETVAHSISTQSEISANIKPSFSPGDYLCKATTQSGYVLAEGYLEVVEPKLSIKKDFKNPNLFTIFITLKDKPISVPNIKVVVDNGKLGTYEFKDSSSITIDLSEVLHGERLPEGKHTFDVYLGSEVFHLEYIVPHRETFLENPFFLLAIVLGGFFLILGFLFRAKQRVVYQLDIPDFPPMERNKVRVTVSQVIQVFEDVNKKYHWRYTPLTLEELKLGFKSIFYKGEPILISDYNLFFILEKLKKKGLVKEYLGYYGLTKWEKKSGRSFRFLASFRKLRDICVNNAVPFTSFDETKGADSYLDLLGQNISVFIYEKNREKEVLSNITKAVLKGTTILLFATNHEKELFLDSLNANSKIRAFLKLEVESKDLLIFTFEEFERFIREMRL